MNEEEDDIIEEKKPEKSFVDRVPTKVRLISIVAIIVAFIFNINMLFVILGIIAYWFISAGDDLKEDELLTPEQAMVFVEQKLEYMKKKKLIPLGTRIYISQNYDLYHSSAIPKYYLFGVTFIHNSRKKEIKKFMVFADGRSKGYVLVKQHYGKFTGEEKPYVRDLIPSWIKQMKEYDMEKYFLK